MWKLKEVDEERLSLLRRETGLAEAVLRVLLLRGLETPSDITTFLHPDLNQLYPSHLLPNIRSGIERMKEAIKRKERILIWGHEDMDGITSTVLLKEVLRDLRIDCAHFIPKKHQFKYGIYPPKVLNTEEWLGEDKISLLIAVDCGITNVSPVRELKENGVETIIIDHHEATGTLPEAVAIINPKIPKSQYPFRDLAAVGVVFKFCAALIESILKVGIKEWIKTKKESLVFVTLGSLSDRVPLVKENRIIVKEGLKILKEENKSEFPLRPSLRMISGFDEINTFFSLVASLDGQSACDFFLIKDETMARLLFDKMVENYENLEKELEESLSLAETVKSLHPGLVVVKNIFLSLRSLSHIANRFKEKYHRPVIALGRKDDGLWVAECRGWEEVNMLDMLRTNANLLLDWGGHKKACGFSIKEENLEDFIAQAKRFAEENFAPKINSAELNTTLVDAILPLGQIPKEVLLLPPFGEGNPSPLFLSLGTELVRNAVRIGERDFPIFDETRKLKLGGRYNIIYTVKEDKIYIKGVF